MAAFLAISAIFTLLAVFVVALRCYSRFLILKRWGAEEIFILCALILTFAFLVGLVIGKLGAGFR